MKKVVNDKEYLDRLEDWLAMGEVVKELKRLIKLGERKIREGKGEEMI